MNERPAAPVLEIAGLNRSFVDGSGSGNPVIQNFSLSVSAGESVALWGPSGSGKTTLLNLVAGLLKPDSGSILVCPKSAEQLHLERLDEAGLAAYRCLHVGYVFQFFNLIPTLNVRENVQLALELAGKLEQWPAYVERFAQLGLTGLEERFPAHLSGGEQQRVAVLRALAHAPALVLADEPTGNLDRTNSQLVADLLWQQSQAQNTALLIATHSEAIAERADRVLELV